MFPIVYVLIVVFLSFLLWGRRAAPKAEVSHVKDASTADAADNLNPNYVRFRVWYATENGTSLSVAQKITKEMNTFLMENDEDVPCAVVLPLSELDVDNFASLEEEESSPEDVIPATTFSLATREPLQKVPRPTANRKVLNVFVVSTYAGGSAPANAVNMFNLMDDMSQDFRVSGNAWGNHHFAVFGNGEKVYADNYNRFAISLQEVLSRKGGYSIFGKPHLSDIDYTDRDTTNFIARLKKYLSSETKPAPMTAVKPKKEKVRKETTEADIEEAAGTDEGAADEMINPRIRQGLTKQGYTLFGTHSGVKLCRWTKSMMRGHGGCYKHTFYGISSLACMEMTPSLACANKCVFCWRHHTNPTAREWRWKHDPPEFVINGALEGHRRMLKVLRGVPGVTEERLREAMQVRHCALSLVGEPIIYPEINKLISLMHQNEISTFLVTNAQFPDRIRDLPPATQLYVSVDAGDKASLQAIDRPIFEDFWDRYLECIRLLALKKQRTVFRLTLVKNYNVNEVDGYISLVRLGKPEFIEVKGVTYCGDNGENGISMRNVPYHHEVIEFCQLLLERIGDTYDIACEHEHSCCVLLARKEFKINGAWHTWIDYSKFFELVRSGEPFTSMDYLLPTPEWGVYGSAEKGFDPNLIRKKLRHKGPIAGGC